MSGTVQLRTERLILRKHRIEDAKVLHRNFGMDPVMYEYSGWNPYATEQMAEETVRRFINSYEDSRFYGWAAEYEGELIGTVGAYDFDQEDSSIEIGCSIERKSWGKGFAGEAVTAVLKYLTEHEGISLVRAWCAAENTGSRKVMEKAGMVCTGTEAGALLIEGRKHDRMDYQFAVSK